MKNFLKKFHMGQKGFTLIELLVVIAILGVLAAVVIPNVASLMGRGKVEAANTEAHNVLTAVITYMAENNLSDYDGSVAPGDHTGPGAYITGTLEATYTIVNGAITAATPTEGGKWSGLTYTAGSGWDEA